MSIKEKLYNIPVISEGRNLRLGGLDEKNKCLDEIIKIYDEFTIEFTEWVIYLKDSDIDSIDYHFYLNSTIEELLYKYKTL